MSRPPCSVPSHPWAANRPAAAHTDPLRRKARSIAGTVLWLAAVALAWQAADVRAQGQPPAAQRTAASSGTASSSGADTGQGWNLEPAIQLALQLPGMSHHFTQPRQRGRTWNETHWGIGVESRSAFGEGWGRVLSLGVMRDSVDMWGAHAGYTLQRHWVRTPQWTVDAGGGAFLFYRSLHFDGRRQWLPGLLPVLSVGHVPTGLGLNLVWVPPLHFNGGKMPSVVYAQFTKRL